MQIDWVNWMAPSVLVPAFLWVLSKIFDLRKEKRIKMTYFTVGHSNDRRDYYIQVKLETKADNLAIKEISCKTAGLARYTRTTGIKDIWTVPMYPWKLSYAFSFDPNIRLKAGKPYVFFISARPLPNSPDCLRISLKASSIFCNPLLIAVNTKNDF